MIHARACSVVSIHTPLGRAPPHALIRDIFPIHHGLRRAGELTLHRRIVGIRAIRASLFA